jgi:hypothetical protein
MHVSRERARVLVCAMIQLIQQISQRPSQGACTERSEKTNLKQKANPFRRYAMPIPPNANVHIKESPS